ncbi:MAG: hypothetical protein JWL79_2934 [Frankiales bacterium]|nr:hypothetical protein [Frankiales bacterium]
MRPAAERPVSRYPAPAAGRPLPPVGGSLYAVRWMTTRGEGATRLFRQRRAAERFVAVIHARGGDPDIYTTQLAPWTLMHERENPHDNP